MGDEPRRSGWTLPSLRERGGYSAGSRSLGWSKGNGGGFLVPRKREQGAPVDGRHLGPNVTRCLTHVRCGGLLPTGFVPAGEMGCQRLRFERLERLITPSRAKHPSRWELLSLRQQRERRMRGRSWRHGVKRASTRAEVAAKRFLTRESSGCSGARARDRLQKSVRSIFPRGSLCPKGR